MASSAAVTATSSAEGVNTSWITATFDVFDTVGADALRWYFLARLSPDVQKRISVDIVADVASSFINTFWNTYGFFVLYARLDEIDLTQDVAVADRPEIDRWALALLHDTIVTVTEALDNYDAKGAGEAIESFVGRQLAHQAVELVFHEQQLPQLEEECCRQGLPPEPGNKLLIASQLAAQHLDGHVAIERLLKTFVDHGHPTLAQLGQNAVMAESLPDHLPATPVC